MAEKCAVHRYGQPKSVCVFILSWGRRGLEEADLYTHVLKSCQREEIVDRFDTQQPIYLSVDCVVKKPEGCVSVMVCVFLEEGVGD